MPELSPHFTACGELPGSQSACHGRQGMAETITQRGVGLLDMQCNPVNLGPIGAENYPNYSKSGLTEIKAGNFVNKNNSRLQVGNVLCVCCEDPYAQFEGRF